MYSFSFLENMFFKLFLIYTMKLFEAYYSPTKILNKSFAKQLYLQFLSEVMDPKFWGVEIIFSCYL